MVQDSTVAAVEEKRLYDLRRVTVQVMVEGARCGREGRIKRIPEGGLLIPL